MRILILTDSYPPETRSSSHLMKEMADGLRERGHEVFIVTSLPAVHANEHVLPNVSREDGISVIRVRVLPHHNVGFILKGVSQLLLPFLFFHQAKKHIKGKLDIVWVHSPPLPLTITAQLVKKSYGAKYFLNLHDFFPQNAIDLGILRNGPLIRFFQNMERRAYANSDVIVTPSEAHKRFMHEKRGVPLEKIHVVPHWIDVRPFEKAERTGRFRTLYGLEGKFIFVFGGVLGPSQGLDLFIRIAEKMREHKDITFLFVGEGSEKKRLMDIVRDRGLDNVIFKPFVSKEEYPLLLKDADVGILSLTNANTTPAVPAKLVGYMAASLPVLAFLHEGSEGIGIVRDSHCGCAAVSNDEAQMLACTEKMYKERESFGVYGTNGFRYVLRYFAKDVCLNKIQELFSMAILWQKKS